MSHDNLLDQQRSRLVDRRRVPRTLAWLALPTAGATLLADAALGDGKRHRKSKRGVGVECHGGCK